MKKKIPEIDLLEEARQKIIEMSFDECKEEVGHVLDEIHDLYFDWINKLLRDSEEEFEVVASEEPNSNVIMVDFGKKK